LLGGELSAKMQDTEAPNTVMWDPEAINSVTITGPVLTSPEMRRSGGNQVLAKFRLGLKRKYAPRGGAKETGTITVDAWGYQALQAAQHLKEGMQVGSFTENSGRYLC
jgi:hypothetical protein